MNTVTAENLSPISHNQLPVITTELLAQLYGTDTIRIQQNHKRNDDRFIAGKHFYKLDGAELKEFKNRLSLSEFVGKRARSLILWTERGAARHAKMLETDQAWEVFERLEDCYFSHKSVSSTVPAVSFDSRAVAYLSRGSVVSMYTLADDQIVMTLDSMKQLLESQGWTLFRKDELLTKLANALNC